MGLHHNVLSFALLFACCTLVRMQGQSTNQVALPKSLTPFKYNLLLVPDLTENVFRYTGWVTIQMKCVENTNRIVLHQKDLGIEDAQIVVSLTPPNDATKIETKNFEGDKNNEFYIINMKTTLTAGTDYQVVIPFTGNLRTDSTGFYRSSYDEGGKKKWMASTFFNPNYARRAFPCLDEVGFQATFVVSVSRAQYLKSYSNMPINTSTSVPDGGFIVDQFKETSKISTKDLCIVVTELQINDALSVCNSQKSL